MSFIRFVSELELCKIAQSGNVLKNNGKWAGFDPGTIICMFEADDFMPLLNRYAVSLAQLRDLKPGDFLYVLLFIDLQPHRIQDDTTANSWLNSRIYLESISANKVKVVASMLMTGDGPDLLENGPVKCYDSILSSEFIDILEKAPRTG